MSENVTLQVSELAKVIRDEVSKAVADRAVESLEAAKEHGEKVLRDSGSGALLAEARKQGATPRAEVSADGSAIKVDPHNGRGLGFARFARTMALAKTANLTPVEAARSLGRENSAYNALAESGEIRAMSSGSFAAGGALVPPEFAAEMVELLYAASVTQALGVRSMEFTASIGMGKLNSGATVGYVGEAANVVPTTPATSELRMTGKKAMALVAVSGELLRNPGVGADALIRDDLLMALALRRDLSVLRGAGDTFQPKGLLNSVNSSNVFASTGTTQAAKVADLVKAIRLVDESNVPLTSGGWVMSPRSKWSLFSTLDGNGQFVFAAQLALGNLLGFPLKTTTQIPNNLGGGSESEIHFGAWNDLILGFDKVTPLQVKLSEDGAFHDGSAVVSGFSSDQTPIRIMEGHDVCLRHDNTFSRITGVSWT